MLHKEQDIEQFILNIPKNIKAVLLYGPDSGLVKTRVEVISKLRNIAGKFKYEQIKTNPSLFLDSLRSIKLFGEDLTQEKIALIECAGSSLAEPVLSIMKEANYQGLVVFFAGELGPESSLRRFFEASPHAATIPCYIEDQAAIARLIQQIFKQKQITCEAGLVQLLLNYIAVGNHSLILSEIEKILLFIGEKKHIIADDLKDYLQLQGEVSFDKLCYQLSLRELGDIELLLSNLQNEGHNLVSIIRMLMRHFNRLYQVKLLIEQGKTEQQALDSLIPSVFFKQVNDFSKSIKLWSKLQLIEFLQQLNNLELAAKTSAMPSGLMLRKTMLKII